MLVSQSLIEALAKGPTHTAVYYMGKKITYKELTESIAKLSYLFQKEIGAEQRVAFLGSNSPAYVKAFMALSNNRCLFIPIDPTLSDDEVCEWIYDTTPTHIMVTEDFIARFRDLFRRRGISTPVIDIEKKKGGEFSSSFVPPADQTPKDTDQILLLRSAATAGEYKYCSFNHNQVIGAAKGLKKPYKPTAGDIFFTIMNWSHPYAFMHSMVFPLLSGSSVLIHLGHEAKELLDFILKAKATRLIGYAEFFQKLLMVCKYMERPLVGIKSVTVSLGSLSPVMCKIFGLMKTVVSHCYGNTECLWSIAMSSTVEEHENNQPPCRALAGYQYKVVDKFGEEIVGKTERSGRLAFSGGSIMTAYVGKEADKDKWKKKTQGAVRGTWFYTEDQFTLNGENDELSIEFNEREDGLNPTPKIEDTYSAESIKKVLKKQVGVSEALVFRASEAKSAPIFCAVIVNEECELTGYQLLQEIKSGLTPKNIPDQIRVLEEFPLVEETQELDLKALRAIFEGKEVEKKSA